jgi:hypothetical protein
LTGEQLTLLAAVSAYLAVALVVTLVCGWAGVDLVGTARRAAVSLPASRRSDHGLRLGPVSVVAGAYLLGLVVAVLAWVLLRDSGWSNSLSVDGRTAVEALLLGWCLVVVNAVVATQLIEALLPPNEGKHANEHRLGGPIGILERLLVAVLTLSGGPVTIGFVIAAKTLARFKQIESDKDFAERYLLGTLSSVGIALVSALAVAQIWTCR